MDELENQIEEDTLEEKLDYFYSEICCNDDDANDANNELFDKL